MEPRRLRAIIAANIRRHAARRGFSMPALADTARVGTASFYRVLKCETSVRADTLAKIAGALEVLPRELLDERTVDTTPARRRR